MDSYERVVSCQVMRLRSQETLSGRKEYIVVGSTIVTGEEFQCKGKVTFGICFVAQLSDF